MYVYVMLDFQGKQRRARWFGASVYSSLGQCRSIYVDEDILTPQRPE